MNWGINYVETKKMSPMVFCHTVSDPDQKLFDQKVSEALNEKHRENYTYKVTFLQDEDQFYAHIIFTEEIELDNYTGG
jgi:hypothetical protein